MACSPPLPTRLVDAFGFANGCVILAAATLCAASARAMGLSASPPLLALAAGGTGVVYGLDRLRDVERDRRTSPRRTAFVERHRPLLVALTVASALAAFAGALQVRAAVLGVAAAVAVFGFFHRRLKRLAWAKAAYLTLAWTAVAVGMPLASHPQAAHGGWVAGVVGLGLLCNVILSNLKDEEGATVRLGPQRARRLALGCAALAVGLAALAPAAVRPLAAVPLVMGLAAAGFRRNERYSALVVDGGLALGALVALALSAAGA